MVLHLALSTLSGHLRPESLLGADRDLIRIVRRGENRCRLHVNHIVGSVFLNKHLIVIDSSLRLSTLLYIECSGH